MDCGKGGNVMSLRTGKGKEDTFFDIIVAIIAIIALIVTLYPLYFIVIASISDPNAVLLGDVILLPKGINFVGYKYIFEEQKIWLGYRNTIFYTVVGTLFGVTVTLLAGYALSRKDLIGRNVIMKIMVFTMFFNGGLIPTYMVVSSLNLVNNPLVLIILGSVWVYNIIITRTFFQSTLPEEMREAAFIDGCGNLRFFISIAIPLSKAIVAVISLFYAVGHWNSYFNALIYITKKELHPLQLILRELLIQGQSLVTNMDSSEMESLIERERIAQAIKYGVIIVSTLPVIIAYPLLQKYFVKGVMIGSIKG